jgi:hypothetical protein
MGVTQDGAAIVDHLRKELVCGKVSVVRHVRNVKRHDKRAIPAAVAEHEGVPFARHMIQLDIALIVIVVVFGIEDVIIRDARESRNLAVISGASPPIGCTISLPLATVTSTVAATLSTIT